jgi:urease accessory protein
VRAELAIGLHLAGDGSVVARGALAVPPYWCRWDGATLWLVGSAATPVGDDDITLDLHVGAGVTAAVRSVAATLVYAARGEGTRLTTRLHVDSGATLTWQPEPVIVTARARHGATVVADVASGGALVADELVVLGRSDEVAGGYRAVTDLRRDGAPICLTSFDTATPGWSGPGGTAGAKVVGTRLVVDPSEAGDDGRWAPVDSSTVVLRPEGGGSLVTTLAPDPVQARAQLDAATIDAATMDERLGDGSVHGWGWGVASAG